MILFAAKDEWGWVIALVFAGIAIINKILGSRQEEREMNPRPRPAPRPRVLRAGPMAPRDIGQVLDEVLAGRPIVLEPAPPPRAPMATRDDLVARRSAGTPQRAAVRARVARPVQPRPAQGKQAAPTTVRCAGSTAGPATPIFAEWVREVPTQTTVVAQIAPGQQSAGPSQGQASTALQIMSTFHSLSDIRRAFILREVLGPPLSRRRR